MSLVKKIAIIVLCISFVVFVALFGRLPAFRKTPIGFLHRLIWIHTPRTLSTLDNRITGGRIFIALERVGHYLLFEPHPIVLIFFILLLSISELIFIPACIPLLPSPAPLHYALVPIIATLPFLTLYHACTRSSLITASTHAATLTAYPYDYTLFHPTQPPCRTCHLPKPARSRHCSLCGACVAKADHHCIWLNACVGRNNYVYFLALLASLSLLCAYGTFLAHRILTAQLQARLVAPTTSMTATGSAQRWTTGLSWRRWLDLWGWAVQRQWRIGSVGLLTLMSWPLVTGLLAYHVYLLWAGVTTNESAKWADLGEDVGDGLVWKARRTDVLAVEERARREREWPWPIRGQWVVAVLRPGETPMTLETSGQWRASGDVSGGSAEPGRRDERWVKVTSLKELENVYDLGFWDNLRDAIFNRD